MPVFNDLDPVDDAFFSDSDYPCNKQLSTSTKEVMIHNRMGRNVMKLK